jgi:putative addiction module component (TIGR02574 family)
LLEGLHPRCLDEAFRSRYCFAMSTEQLIADAMALPLSERVSLAQALWESIDTGLPDTDERAAITDAIRRDRELSSNRVAGRTHEEVMQAARRALECD